MKRRDRNLSVSGFTLVEILVATGLFCLLNLVVVIAATAFLENARQTNLRTTRDQIVNQLSLTAFNKKAILNSLKKPENVEFYKCMCGVGGTCTNMQKPFLPFTLYDVGNTVQSPGYYDVNGAPCSDPTKPQCRIHVTTSFFAQCQPDFTSPNQTPTATCGNGTPAEFIAILYTIDENPNLTNQKGSLLRATSGLTYIQTADIGAGACP
ncbi:MAG: type II secretion system protein [Pseudobdellovibrionaceae bacterium]